ncbi:nitroreductase family protein [Nannocystis pusilla]|uniref:Nitroreductase family protein n=1 Tax=Nannocystis pusilla TaxID=889268 RepID=A0A9X3EUM9_9BACT|nr:nitroreductase family protein [Nannocystis pusilla]MCY1010568.1 nitroreductase family protein [Nannocystis pusilla]
MTATPRTPDADVHPMFLDRWSPRAFRPEPLTDAQLASLFEAMRWAPSSYNEQPWMVVYGHGPGTEDHKRVLGCLVSFNQSWAHNAPLVMILFGRRRFAASGKANRHAGFDCGSAWMSLALQARVLGLYAHAMAGFDEAKTYTDLGVPEPDFEAMAAIAVGAPGDPESLPDSLRAREGASARVPAASFLHRGRFSSAG